MTANTPKNPLGLNIDFLFGRGYLWAKHERLTDWITLESLRMEIPDLQFPFDARGGLHRFRFTRCLVREIEILISEAGLQDLLTRAAEHIDGFKELRVRFIEDAIHVGMRLGALGSDAYVSFRIALIPPEPPNSDELHLSLYDYRAYGPMPYPARLLAFELMTSLLGTPILRPPGRGASFTVGIAGDILSFRPLKLLLLHLFPRVGWKLPNLSDIVLDGARIRPGQLSLRASTRDGSWYTKDMNGEDYKLAGTREGARALAAYEAKDLFAHVDQAIFDHQMPQAMDMLATYRDMYGMHPELMARTLDGLLCDPNPSHLAEANAICRELQRDDPESMHAALARPTLKQFQKRPLDEILLAYDKLAALLRERQDFDDWILCTLTQSRLLAKTQPHKALMCLREILKVSPRNLTALERLRTLSKELSEWSSYEEALKRLTGVYTSRSDLTHTYMKLADHLMHRRGQVTEARLYLEKVLRLAPQELEALHTLGESYVLSQEPLRALKAFGSAARAAEARELFDDAARLQMRIAKLWHGPLNNPAEALLSCQRAVHIQKHAMTEGQTTRIKPLERIDMLTFAAELCQERERWDEALRYWIDLLPELEHYAAKDPHADDPMASSSALGGLSSLSPSGSLIQNDSSNDSSKNLEKLSPVDRRIQHAHRHIAIVYEQRLRPEAATTHWLRVLHTDPEDEQAASHLESFYRQGGTPQQLLRLWKDILERTHEDRRKIELHRKLATLYIELDMVEEAREQLDALLLKDVSDEHARELLITTLHAAGRFETLRDVLLAMLVRVRDRDLRFTLLMQVAPLQLNALRTPRHATRAYFEALDLRPESLEALSGARHALDEVIASEGRDTPAPVGKDNAGRLLERVLQKIVDLLPNRVERIQALDELASLAQWRGDQAAFEEASRRATSMRELEPQKNALEAQKSAMFEHTLDTLLTPKASSQKPKDIRGPEFTHIAQSKSEITNPRANSLSTMISNLPKIDDIIIDDLKPVGANVFTDQEKHSELLQENDQDSNQDSNQDKSTSLFRDRMRKVFKQKVARDKLSDLLAQQEDRQDRHQSSHKLKLPTTLDLDLDEQDPQEQHLQGNKHHTQNSQKPQKSPSALVRMQDLLDEVERVKRTDNVHATVHALRNVIKAYEANPSRSISPGRLLGLHHELGQLLYYDLEDAIGAKPHLEYVHNTDPNGLGAQPGVINALESVYEEMGAVHKRIQILRQRLEQTTSEDMADTFRLLIAQLEWNERHDAQAAQAILMPTLKRAPEHEAANRFLAQVARDQLNWSGVIQHLELVLRERSGGLDEVETERELADVYKDHIKDYTKACAHYERVLQDAPADAQALEGIKQCQAAIEDWRGYVSSLSRELTMLAPNIEGLDLWGDVQDWPVESFSAALRHVASQVVSDAAEVMTTNMKDERVQARALWGKAYALWPEHVEALERRIALDREQGEDQDLAMDLEAMADLLLNQHERFALMSEAAKLRATTLDDAEGARRLYAEAIAMVQDDDVPPPAIDEVRRALQTLQSQ